MSFTQFLNWLYGLRDRVVWLIQDAWSQVTNVVNNAWNWAVQRAIWAYNAAAAYAWDLVNDLHITLNDTVQMLWQDISNAANWALNEARELVDAVRAYAWNLYLSISGYAEWLYNQAVAYALDRFNEIKAWVLPLIEAAKQAALALVAPIVTWYNAVKATVLAVVNWWNTEWPAWREAILNLISIFTADNLAKLLDFFDRVYNWLVNFFDDPIGTIVAYFAPILIEWAEDALGHALGAENAELPPPKIFGRHGY